jgi:hypothetical protein
MKRHEHAMQRHEHVVKAISATCPGLRGDRGARARRRKLALGGHSQENKIFEHCSTALRVPDNSSARRAL